MVKHFIIIASAYSIGKRIALDYFDTEQVKIKDIKKDMDHIIKECGDDVSISTHYIQTEELGWDKVVKLDKFFAKVKLIDTKEEFVEILLKDRNLKGIDIAKYILTKIPCTHLKLEKMTYMCYADYLYQTGNKLFEDKIYAYKLGPVVKSVYDKYKKKWSKYLYEDDEKVYDEHDKNMPIKSRILASKDGIKKLISIDKTIEKYREYSASKLVNLTHQKSTPWSMSGKGEETYKEIEDDLIIKYHKYEEN